MSTLVKTHFANPSYLNGFFGKDLFNELATPAFAGSVPAVNVVENQEGFNWKRLIVSAFLVKIF